MFTKGTMKDDGIDITLRNNPDHFLAPDDINIVRDFKFEKISTEEFKKYYSDLLRERWDTRRPEFLALVKKGKTQEVKLKCTCSKSTTACHAKLAAKFLNGLVSKL
jgi:hypothetical protein